VIPARDVDFSPTIFLIIFSLFLTVLPVNADYYWGASVNTANLSTLEGSDGRRLSLEDGREFGLSWGGQVSSLRVQYSLESLRSQIKSYRTATTNYTPDGTFTARRVLLEFFGYESVPGLPARTLSPFWGFGVGMSRFSIEDLRVPGEISIDSSEDNLTGQIMVGFDYRFLPGHRINLQYRYLMTDDLGYEDTRNDIEYEFQNFTESTIGLQYRWFY
jgi:opacity protein-like surface antigen